MKKLPVAGPTYDYKLENIRNDIIEQELALCLKKRENVYLDEDVQVKYTAADGTEYTFGQVTEDTVSLQTDVTTLQSNFTTLDGEVTANATAVSGLETRVTSAEGSISSNSTAITSLQTDLTSAESDIAANSSAVTTLTSSVSTLDGEVSALSSSVTSLSTTVGTNTTNISTNTSSINGIEGKYAVKINNNGHVSGFGLISTANNATPTSTFTVTADAFKIVDTSGSATPTAPFEVYTSARVVDGVTVPAGVYMENANITAANIKTLDVDVINLDGVTLDTSGGQLIVKDGGVDTVKLASDAVSTQSKTFVSSFTLSGSTQTFGQVVATLNVSGVSGDKFLCIGTVNYFGLPVADDSDFFGGYIFLNNTSTVYLDRIGSGYDSTQKGGFTLAGINTLNTTGSSIPLDFRIQQLGISGYTASVFSIHLQAIKLER